MSLITRCPACSTLFKVVPDQLRVAQGWVRCGQCGEMFIATEQLAPPDEVERAQTPVEPDRSAATAALMAELPDLEIELPASEAAELVDVPAAPAELSADPPTGDVPPPVTVLEAPPTYDAVSPVDPGTPDALVDVPAASDPTSLASEVPFLATSADHAQPAPASRSRRGLLALAAVLLALALLLQIAVDRRDVLAARWPALTPALQGLCQPLGCRVAPLRQIDAVVIEASSFQRLQADRFRLGATLRNRADWQVATPTIELTLTDAQDQPLARRVLAPKELGAAAALPVRADMELARELVIAAPVDAAAVAGYKLLLFYP